MGTSTVAARSRRGGGPRTETGAAATEKHRTGPLSAESAGSRELRRAQVCTEVAVGVDAVWLAEGHHRSDVESAAFGRRRSVFAQEEEQHCPEPRHQLG